MEFEMLTMKITLFVFGFGLIMLSSKREHKMAKTSQQTNPLFDSVFPRILANSANVLF